MARALDETVRLDRCWFWAHPKRRHRCRSPDTGERDLCDSDRGARLVMAIRHLGRGHVVYHPVIFQGALPADEESAAALFALAATSPEPIPVITQMDMLRLRHGLRQQTQSHEASARVATNRKRGRRIKRALDLIIAGLAVLLTAPLMLLIALMIKLDSPGSVLFVQERLGQARVPFRCFKFRTMCEDAERHTGPIWSHADDPRITRVGRHLRKTRMDELPQLFNVLRGEMSLVGPRPIRQHFADQLAERVPLYDLRFLEKPGLTGWAQINYGYAASLSEQETKFLYDYYYIRHRSTALDLYIILSTSIAILRGERSMILPSPHERCAKNLTQ
jgi:lipopolysaccharide/colanic/teichoic acid biosynthesis glycosyltransferase